MKRAWLRGIKANYGVIVRRTAVSPVCQSEERILHLRLPHAAHEDEDENDEDEEK